jgi:sterol desaturase/sphingolipid hydroxylase (fatty acid hydroxylase superfamily)
VNKPNISGRNIPDHLKPNPGAPIMFSNGLLGSLSKISPVTVLGLYIPLSGYSLWLASTVSEPAEIIGLATVYFLGWALFEHVFHRGAHHFLDTRNGYSISIPFWNYIFGTIILNRSKTNADEPKPLE